MKQEARVAPEGSTDHVWDLVRHELLTEFGDVVFRNWLRPMAFGGRQGDQVILTLPTRFARDWVDSHYRERLRLLWRRFDSSVVSIDLHVAATVADLESALKVTAGTSDAPRPTAPLSVPAVPRADGSDSASFGEGLLDPRLNFTNFVVGKPNELAYAAARRVAESRQVPFNPLFLHGGVGLGKTHLMHAIAWAIRERDPSRRVVYVSAEKFMHAFVRSLRYKDTMAFKEEFRSADVLMVDDFQFLADKQSSQEEFFHTFNALVDRNRQIIVSADKGPHDLEGIGERLKSRLGWGLVADIHPTNFELRLGILQARVEQLGCDVPAPVLQLLATRVTTNVRELEGALNRLIAQNQLVGEPISTDMAERLLGDLLRAQDKVIQVADIQKAVAERFQLKIADMTSTSKVRKVARPRQVAMYLAKKLTPLSLPDIGRRFGKRDHTTVLYAVNQVERLMLSDPGLRDEVDFLLRLLRGQT